MPERGTRAVAITGANGYVGSALRVAFAASGYRVIALQRAVPPDGSSLDHIHYSLGGGLERTLPDDVVAVIHCAYDLRERDRSTIELINLGGTERLLAEAGSTPVVLISSMSAFPGTSQIYGQTKLACEDLVAAQGGTSLRLGLVHGDTVSGGMVGALRKVATVPIVPMPHPDPFQYTVHVDDVAQCVISTVERRPPHRVLGVANPRRVPLSEIIRELRATTRSVPLRSVPISPVSLHRMLCLIETMGLRINFRADSVLSLMNSASEVPHVDYWQQVGIVLRDFVSKRRAASGGPDDYNLASGS